MFMSVATPLRADNAASPLCGALELALNGAWVHLLPEGALWWGEARLLVVSDLHLEKASSLAARGKMLPPYDTKVTLDCVADLILRLQPDTVISLGDSFHDARAEERLTSSDAARIRKLTNVCDWWWVEGNHDPAPPQGLGGRAAPHLDFEQLFFCHEPELNPRKGEVSGHFHPCAKVVGRAGRAVRTRCFASDGSRLIMPALGAFTGGLNVLDDAYVELFPKGVQIFATGREGVYAVSGKRLLPDGGAGGTRWTL